MILITVIFLIFFFIFLYNHEKISKIYNLYDNSFSRIKRQKTGVPITGGIFFLLSLILYSSFIIYLKENNYEIFDNIYLFRNLRDFVAFNTAALFFFLIGVFDDKFNLSPNYRLFFFTVLSYSLVTLDNSIQINKIIFTSFNYTIQLNQFSLLFTILCFIVFINSFNMLDGINGLAPIYTIIFSINILLNNFDVLLPKLIIIMMIFYLYLNLKSKSFMGDGGSYLIGFLLSFLVIKYNLYGFLSTENILILMALPVSELIRVASSRIISGKHPFQGDQNHIHHLLMRSLSFNKTLMTLILLVTLPCIIYNYTSMFIFPLVFFLLTYVFVIFKTK
jgi:UDP-GlcNAc:undecaprenyl-phosphate GlcNAc-1-phosphate transferase